MVTFNQIDGTNNEDVLNGTEGNDIIRGLDRTDFLNGNGGNDILVGGDGDDVLNGGEGNDILLGGLRRDVFQFSGNFGNDIVADFDEIGDLVQFEGADRTQIETEFSTNGVLLTVDSDLSSGSVFLLGVDEDGFNEIFI